jgi:spermidine synthase
MKSLGNHIVVEYFHCDPALLNDVVYIEDAMIQSAKKAEATIINSTFHHFSPFGVSGVVVIQESHLAIHTWPEYGFASVDIFTCGDAVDPWICYNTLKDLLKAAYGSAIQMNRGPEDLLPKTDFDLQQYRSEQKEMIPEKIKTTRDIWYTERNEYIALSLKHEGEKLFDEKSTHQRVEVYNTYAYGKMLTLDGMVMCTEQDEYVYHEMIAHVPMMTHPEPKEILVIGGGDGGTARELLKHSFINKITLVEIDEKVIEAARNYFPHLASSFEDRKLDLHIQNGIEFVERSPESRYDLVIIDSNDPVGPAKGLFTEKFYKNVHGILKENGLLITQSESPRFNQKVFQEIYRCFYSLFGKSQVFCFLAHIPTYPTGMWSFSYCSKSPDLHPVKNLQTDRLVQLTKNNNLRYYNGDVHAGAFALPNFVQELLQ